MGSLVDVASLIIISSCYVSIIIIFVVLAFCSSFSFVLDVGPLPHVIVDELAIDLHLLHFLVDEFLIVIALLLAFVDGSQLMAKLLHDLLEPLGQVVDRPSHELTIDNLLLIE